MKRKCKTCQSKEKHNDDIPTPQDNNMSEYEDNAEDDTLSMILMTIAY